MTTLANGFLATVHYTGRLDSGEIFDSTDGNEPFRFVVGKGHVIPGFDHAVIGLAVGQETTVKISPADGYGDRDERRVIEVPRDQMGELDAEVGAQLVLEMANGAQTLATVTALGKKTVSLDLNHPLAGKTLHFTIKVTGIQEDPGDFEPEGGCCDSHGCGSEEEGCCGCHGHDDEEEGHDHGHDHHHGHGHKHKHD